MAVGKMASNERTKLRATFYNSVAAIMVGAAVGLPLYSIFSDTMSGVIARVQAEGLCNLLDRSVGIGLFVGLGWILHHRAQTILLKLEDDSTLGEQSERPSGGL